MKEKLAKKEKADSDDRKSFPFRLAKTTLKALKLRAIEQETSVQKILENLVQTYLDDQSDRL